MKKLLLPLLILGLVFSSCEQEDLNSATELEGVAGKAKKGKKAKNTKANFTFDENSACEATKEAELYAGQHELVGKVIVEVVGDNYEITYALDAGYCLKETHLSVVTTPGAFPMSGGGNPPPGQFEFKESHDCVSSFTYTVPTNRGTYIAAHAVVNCVELYVPELPETLDFCTVANGGSGAGDAFVADPLFGPYLEVKLDLDGDTTEEHFSAWCIDVLGSIGVPQCVEDATVYSSLGDYPTDRFTNMNKVNWLLNNFEKIIGETSSGEGGIYNYGDVQNAIWLLINGIPCQGCNGLGDYDTTFERAEEIVAMTEGQHDYLPGCDEYFGVLIVPVDSEIQPIIVRLPINCKEACSETAWARNQKEQECGNFPGNNWATFFKFGE